MAVRRRVLEMQRNGLRSARALPKEARAFIVGIARAEAASFEAYPLAFRDEARADVRARLAAEERRRLDQLAAGTRKRAAKVSP